MSNNISQETLAELKQAFFLFDKNGDGTISESELASVLENLGQKPTEEEIKDMMREVDADGNGEIDFDEFVTMMSQKMQSQDKDEEIKEAFKVFDRDGDGKISKHELYLVMKALGENLTEDEVEEMIKEADINGDGEIDFFEFKEMMGG